jgi:hypothetical protein
MRGHRVTVRQVEPEGNIREFTLDVIASSADSALGMVYSWYDRATHYMNETKELEDHD